jgi:hypothetical protein
MVHESEFLGEFFSRLTDLDAEIARHVAAARCPWCKGPLHQSNYERKPRGALLAEAGEAFSLRHSLCCGRPGCRRRSLPPSLRFLGRRVYVEAVVLIASVVVTLLACGLAAASRETGVPRRTLRRWGAWWTETFPISPLWIELKARFAPPPPASATMPLSLVDRLSEELSSTRDDDRVRAPSLDAITIFAARLLAPATTSSVADGSRFLREIFPSPDPP